MLNFEIGIFRRFLLESLQQSVNALQFENDKLRVAIRDKMGGKVPRETWKDFFEAHWRGKHESRERERERAQTR